MTVHEDFIEPLLVHFDAPVGADRGRFLADLTADLSCFSSTILREAAGHIRRSRRYRTFPNVADCLAACREVTGRPSAEPVRAHVLPWDHQPADLRHRERVRRDAARACCCDLGREADRDGWLPGLIDFVVSHGRLPHGREVAPLQGKARQHEDAIQQVADEAEALARVGAPVNAMAPTLYGFRRALLERAHEEVFGADVRPPRGFSLRERAGLDG